MSESIPVTTELILSRDQYLAMLRELPAQAVQAAQGVAQAFAASPIKIAIDTSSITSEIAAAVSAGMQQGAAAAVSATSMRNAYVGNEMARTSAGIEASQAGMMGEFKAVPAGLDESGGIGTTESMMEGVAGAKRSAGKGGGAGRGFLRLFMLRELAKQVTDVGEGIYDEESGASQFDSATDAEGRLKAAKLQQTGLNAMNDASFGLAKPVSQLVGYFGKKFGLDDVGATDSFADAQEEVDLEEREKRDEGDSRAKKRSLDERRYHAEKAERKLTDDLHGVSPVQRHFEELQDTARELGGPHSPERARMMKEADEWKSRENARISGDIRDQGFVASAVANGDTREAERLEMLHRHTEEREAVRKKGGQSAADQWDKDVAQVEWKGLLDKQKREEALKDENSARGVEAVRGGAAENAMRAEAAQKAAGGDVKGAKEEDWQASQAEAKRVGAEKVQALRDEANATADVTQKKRLNAEADATEAANSQNATSAAKAHAAALQEESQVEQRRADLMSAMAGATVQRAEGHGAEAEREELQARHEAERKELMAREHSQSEVDAQDKKEKAENFAFERKQQNAANDTREATRQTYMQSHGALLQAERERIKYEFEGQYGVTGKGSMGGKIGEAGTNSELGKALKDQEQAELAAIRPNVQFGDAMTTWRKMQSAGLLGNAHMPMLNPLSDVKMPDSTHPTAHDSPDKKMGDAATALTKAADKIAAAFGSKMPSVMLLAR